MASRPKKGCGSFDSSNWWKIPSVTFGALALAFAGFGNIGGPKGYIQVNMIIGDNEMQILRDCKTIIQDANKTEPANFFNKFLEHLSADGKRYVKSII